MSGTLQVNGMRVGVEVRNPVATAQTLVLLHGFTGSAANWGELLDALAADGKRVLALDLPGHGASDAPDAVARYTMEATRETILAASRQYGVNADAPNVLLGYSFGGRVALSVAFAGLFQGIILESASPGLATEAERAVRRASDDALAARIEQEGIPAFVDEWERIPLFASQERLPEAIRARQHAQRLRNSVTGLANSLRGAGTGAQPSLWERLSNLTTLALLLTGELDTKFTAIARDMASRLPNATLHVIPDAGHAAHLEQPAIFASLVNAFCERVRRNPNTKATKFHEEHERVRPHP